MLRVNECSYSVNVLVVTSCGDPSLVDLGEQFLFLANIFTADFYCCVWIVPVVDADWAEPGIGVECEHMKKRSDKPEVYDGKRGVADIWRKAESVVSDCTKASGSKNFSRIVHPYWPLWEGWSHGGEGGRSHRLNINCPRIDSPFLCPLTSTYPVRQAWFMIFSRFNLPLCVFSFGVCACVYVLWGCGGSHWLWKRQWEAPIVFVTDSIHHL